MPSNIECYVQSAKAFVKRNNKYVQIAVTIIAIIAALLFFVMNGEKSPKVDNDKAPSISSLNKVKKQVLLINLLNQRFHLRTNHKIS